MILSNWGKNRFSRQTGKTLGTVTATKLADYPIENNLRRCVVRVISNDDATCSQELKNIYGMPCPSIDDLFRWLLGNGKRFVAVPVTKDDVVDCNGRVIFKSGNAYDAQVEEAIYEIDYKVPVTKNKKEV